jgi:hypothetical protein
MPLNNTKLTLVKLGLSTLVLISLCLPTVVVANPDTETLRPNALGDEENINNASPDVDHYLNVDEATSDDDTSYVATGQVDYLRDLYNLENHSVGSGTINYVKVYANARYTGNVDRASLKLCVKSGTTVDESSEIQLTSTSYTLYSNQWNTNPDTASAWTWSEVDSLQAGVSIRRPHSIETTPRTRVTQVYIEVDYTTATAPSVTSNTFLGFGKTWAVLSGTIDNDGGSTVTEAGFDYGLDDSYGSSWTTTGSWSTGNSFVGVITGLTQATVYHFRAKATNGTWGYGSDMLFSTEGSPVIYEYLNTGGDGASGDIYGNNWAGQSFTVGSTSHTITSFRVYIKRTGNPGTVTLSLKYATGAGLPTGADITSGTLDGNALSTSYTWYEITTTEAVLEAGEKYAVVIRAVAGDDTNDIQWRADTGGGLANAIGCSSTDGGITWSSAAPADYLFEVWGNPCLELVTGAVFSGYLESGDMLFLVHYKNIYAPYYPYDDPSQYFNLQLLDTDGTTLLHQTPCQQWGYVPGSIYINADSASGLTYGSGYYLRIYGTFSGNPSVQYQLTAGDWLGTTAAYLDQWILHTAYDMEDYYGSTLTASVAGKGTVLNEVGGVTFIIGIPELEVVRPDLFQEVSRSVSHIDATLTDAFSASGTWEAMVGSDLEAVADDASTIFGLEPNTLIGIGLLIGYIGIGVCLLPVGYATPGLMLAFPVVIMAVIMFLIDISIIATIVAVIALLAVWAFWWTRT